MAKVYKQIEGIKYPKISEVIHYAADRVLSTSDDYFMNTYSCNAVATAVDELIHKMNVNADCDSKNIAIEDMFDQIMYGFQNMGLKTNAANFGKFSKSRKLGQKCSDRQGARYAWLKFAAMVAEEQGQ